MNGRFAQLALQATDSETGFLDRQEFAELIVQECVNVIQSRYMGDNNREDMEVRRCVEALQKHWN